MASVKHCPLNTIEWNLRLSQGGAAEASSGVGGSRNHRPLTGKAKAPSQMVSNFVPLWEPACLQFREHQLRIDGYLKPPAIGWNQHELRKIAFQLLHDFFGQTGRFGFVVSNLAIDDLDFHCCLQQENSRTHGHSLSA